MGKKIAAFIDRDGTINLEIDNLYKIADLTIIPRAAKAIALLNEHKIPAIVITNQPAVARGLITEDELKKIHREIEHRIEKEGGKIDAVYYCPHHPNATLKKYRRCCDCRKPNTGMFKKAALDFDIDLTKSYMIGDSFRDIEAGKTIGATTIALTATRSDFLGSTPDYLAKNLYEAVKLIIKKERLK